MCGSVYPHNRASLWAHPSAAVLRVHNFTRSRPRWPHRMWSLKQMPHVVPNQMPMCPSYWYCFPLLPAPPTQFVKLVLFPLTTVAVRW